MGLIKQELVNLASLCFDLNAPDFHVMFEVPGHVETASVRVYLGGWRDGDGVVPNYYEYVCMGGMWESTAYRALLQTQAELIKLNEEYRKMKDFEDDVTAMGYEPECDNDRAYDEYKQRELEREQSLLPCPVCNSGADMVGFGGFYHVGCKACHVQTSKWVSEVDAAECWNSLKRLAATHCQQCGEYKG